MTDLGMYSARRHFRATGKSSLYTGWRPAWGRTSCLPGGWL